MKDAKSSAIDMLPLWQSHRHKSGTGTGAVAEWKLERPNSNIPVSTDNAKNQVNAVIEAGLGPQIACFAHVINLATQRGISVNQMDCLFGRIKKVVSFFHQSTTATHVLKTKQEMLQLPPPQANTWCHNKMELHLWHVGALIWAAGSCILCTYRQDPEKKNQMISSPCLMMTWKWQRRSSKPLKTVTTLLSTETAPSYIGFTWAACSGREKPAQVDKIWLAIFFQLRLAFVIVYTVQRTVLRKLQATTPEDNRPVPNRHIFNLHCTSLYN